MILLFSAQISPNCRDQSVANGDNTQLEDLEDDFESFEDDFTTRPDGTFYMQEDEENEKAQAKLLGERLDRFKEILDDAIRMRSFRNNFCLLDTLEGLKTTLCKSLLANAESRADVARVLAKLRKRMIELKKAVTEQDPEAMKEETVFEARLFSIGKTLFNHFGSLEFFFGICEQRIRKKSLLLKLGFSSTVIGHLKNLEWLGEKAFELGPILFGCQWLKNYFGQRNPGPAPSGLGGIVDHQNLAQPGGGNVGAEIPVAMLGVLLQERQRSQLTSRDREFLAHVEEFVARFENSAGELIRVMVRGESAINGAHIAHSDSDSDVSTSLHQAPPSNTQESNLDDNRTEESEEESEDDLESRADETFFAGL